MFKTETQPKYVPLEALLNLYDPYLKVALLTNQLEPDNVVVIFWLLSSSNGISWFCDRRRVTYTFLYLHFPIYKWGEQKHQPSQDNVKIKWDNANKILTTIIGMVTSSMNVHHSDYLQVGC